MEGMALLDRFMNMKSLDMGVMKTFHPTESDLMTYLYRKITDHNNEAFPEICIYGKEGRPPWEIWSVYQPLKFPLQDFIYFFSWAKKNKSRYSRTVGSCGGTWSEAGAKPIYVGGDEEPYGILRKFRFETRKDTSFEHHGAWLMDEYTINEAPDLALCRLKAKTNAEGGGGRNKRKNAADNVENENVTSKNRKLEPARSYQQECSASMPTPSYVHQDDQLVQVVPQNNLHKQGELLMSDDDDLHKIEDFLMSDDDDCVEDSLTYDPATFFDDIDGLMPCGDQSDDSEERHSLMPCVDQLEPANSRQHQPSSPHSHEQQQQQLPGDDALSYGEHDFDIPLNNPILQSSWDCDDIW